MGASKEGGVGKNAIFRSVSKSLGSDASLPNICVYPPRRSVSTRMSRRSDTQREQQRWSSVVCSAAGSPEAEGAFSSPRKGLRQNDCASQVDAICCVNQPFDIKLSRGFSAIAGALVIS